MISKVIQRKSNRERRKLRIRKKVYGTAQMPRLTVFRSNRYIYGQIVDDAKGRTLVSTAGEVKEVHKTVAKKEAAKKCGLLLAEKALQAKITNVVFDRNGYIYTGRVASFADGVREGGLKF